MQDCGYEIMGILMKFFVAEMSGKMRTEIIYCIYSNKEIRVDLVGDRFGSSVSVKVKSISCVRLCDPKDCSLPGCSVRGIFQAIELEWVAISFSRGSSQSRD